MMKRLFLAGVLALLAAPAFAQADCSAAITAGGTAQTLLASASWRKQVTISNADVETETLYVALGATATVPVAVTSGSSFPVRPGGILTLNDPYSTQLISVIAATTGHRIVCKLAG